MEDKLHVFANSKEVGQLFKEDQSYILRYQEQACANDFISLTMPVRRQEYTHHHLHPIFEMHLPEGYLLALLKRHFAKIIGSSDFDLLRLIAPSVRGRLQYAFSSSMPEPLSLHDLLHSKDQALFQELVQRFALHSPISGVQPKVLANILNKATLKLEQYIVKAWGEEYPQLAVNEYWCMRAATLANIPVPEFYISDDKRLFIMKRFDTDSSGKALGFEDFCVLQAKSRDQKYQGSYEQLVKTLCHFVSPQHKQIALQHFFKMIVLNQYLQNGDAHLKNFGVLYEGSENIWLAPAYDIVSTTAYIRNDRSALLLMGSNKWWSKKYLLQFGVQVCELTKQQANMLFDECINALKQTQQEIETALIQTHSADETSILQHLLLLLDKAGA